MRASLARACILAGILWSSACHGSVLELEEPPSTTAELPEPSSTTNIEEQTTGQIDEHPTTTAEARELPSTTKVEECSWCPAPEPSGTTTPHPPALNQADLTDRLQSAAGGTAFADISEGQLLSDIRTICETWKGETNLEDAAARVSQARAELLGVSESEPGLAAYTVLLEASADQRCLRDPMR